MQREDDARDRFDERRLVEREVADLVDVRLRRAHVFGEAAVFADADRRPLLAVIALFAAAVKTVAAKNAGIDRDAIAGLRGFHRGADLDDRPDRFVAADERVAGGDEAAVKNMLIGSADAARDRQTVARFRARRGR